MSNHTPGPWDAKIRRNPFYFPSVLIGPPDVNGRRASIVVNDGRSPEMIADGNGPGGTTRETVEANARLMAGAPALLAACELLIKSTAFASHTALARASREGAIKSARAAIAKAKGENNETETV